MGSGPGILFCSFGDNAADISDAFTLLSDTGVITTSLSDNAAGEGDLVIEEDEDKGEAASAIVAMAARAVFRFKAAVAFAFAVDFVDRVAVNSFHTKHEFPAIWVFGFLPRFFLGICNTVSISELVKAAIDPSITSFAAFDVKTLLDDDCVVLVLLLLLLLLASALPSLSSVGALTVHTYKF